MITGLVISPWVESGGRKRPKLLDDYKLMSWFDAAGKGSVHPDTSKAACEIRCTYEVWEKIVNDKQYRVLWYQEDGRSRRVMGAT